MFEQTLAIIRNTFFESIRQPVMLVMLVVASLLIIFGNLVSGYTMSDDQKMFIDMGLATVFICGAVLAAFVATNVLGREIENRTALTVISKPVSRPVFVVGKYLGVAGALALATIFMSVVFLMVEQHSVLQTVRDPLHMPVILFGLGAAAIGLGVGVWCNYFYNRVFTSTVICVTTPLLVLGYIFSMMFKADFTPQPIAAAIKPQLWLALFSLLVAVMILTAVAIVASTRLGQVLTLCITVAVFMAGLLSDWFVGRRIAEIDNRWSERAAAVDDQTIERLFTERDVESVRAWVRGVYEQRAAHQVQLAQCQATQDLFRTRTRYASAPAADLQRELETATARGKEQVQSRLEKAVKDGQVAEQAVSWPLEKADLVIEFDWPIIVNRIEDECETIVNRKTLIYPALPDKLASTGERFTRLGYRVAYSIVPNFQVLWLSDALTQGHLIPVRHVIRTSIYGLLYIIAALSFAVFLFQRREVG